MAKGGGGGGRGRRRGDELRRRGGGEGESGEKGDRRREGGGGGSCIGDFASCGVITYNSCGLRWRGGLKRFYFFIVHAEDAFFIMFV